MSEHTPLPWEFWQECPVGYEADEDIPFTIGADPKRHHPDMRPYSYRPVAEGMTREDAEFIVCACNNYESLVEACKEALRSFDAYIEDEEQMYPAFLSEAMEKIRFTLGEYEDDAG